MTSVQIGQALLIAVLTGFATAVLNNFVVLYRLRRTWEHEKEERATQWERERAERLAQYRTQRMESMLDPVRAHLNLLLQVYSAAQPSPSRAKIGEAEALAKFRELNWEDEIVRTAVAVVSDETLDEAFSTFRSKVYAAGKDVAAKAEYDNQCAARTTEVIKSAAAVLRRCDELVEEAYQEAIAVE